ncbi:hypothetical protein Zmor_012146 [Zophobas morio]|uniref:Lipoprotein n=1 Tax=Zophobas morio TaxID=2755281 RepID=A0AA38HIM4_9CUCU|nr:hypothetical protein Zmor_012146 [Zophobas morio]
MISILVSIATITGASANVVSCFGIGKFNPSDKEKLFDAMEAAANNRVSFSENEANFKVTDQEKRHEMQNIVNKVLDNKKVKSSDLVKQVRNAENDLSKGLRLDVVSTTGIGGMGEGKQTFGNIIYGDFDEDYLKNPTISDYFKSNVKSENESGIFDLNTIDGKRMEYVMNPEYDNSILMEMNNQLGVPYSTIGIEYDIHKNNGYVDVKAVEGSRRFKGSARITFAPDERTFINEVIYTNSPKLGNVEIVGSEITPQEVIDAFINKYPKMEKYRNAIRVSKNVTNQYGASIEAIEGNKEQLMGSVYVEYNAQIKLETIIPNLDLGDIS